MQGRYDAILDIRAPENATHTSGDTMHGICLVEIRYSCQTNYRGTHESSQPAPDLSVVVVDTSKIPMSPSTFTGLSMMICGAAPPRQALGRAIRFNNLENYDRAKPFISSKANKAVLLSMAAHGHVDMLVTS